MFLAEVVECLFAGSVYCLTVAVWAIHDIGSPPRYRNPEAGEAYPKQQHIWEIHLPM